MCGYAEATLALGVISAVAGFQEKYAQAVLDDSRAYQTARNLDKGYLEGDSHLLAQTKEAREERDKKNIYRISKRGWILYSMYYI